MPSLDEGRSGRNGIGIHIEIINEFVGAGSFSHRKNQTHSVVEIQFSIALACKVMPRIGGKQPEMFCHIFKNYAELKKKIESVSAHCSPYQKHRRSMER